MMVVVLKQASKLIVANANSSRKKATVNPRRPYRRHFTLGMFWAILIGSPNQSVCVCVECGGLVRNRACAHISQSVLIKITAAMCILHAITNTFSEELNSAVNSRSIGCFWVDMVGGSNPMMGYFAYRIRLNTSMSHTQKNTLLLIESIYYLCRVDIAVV